MGATFRVPALLVALSYVSAAHADGECIKGFRDTTADERDTMLAVMAAAKAALPSAPAGWIIGGYEEVSPIGRICMDGEDTPWAYGFSRTFNRTDDAEERERALADAGTAARAAQEARQPRIDALMAKMQTLSAQLGPAAQSGDQARIDAIQRNLDALSKQFETVMAEGSDQALLETVAAATMRDRTMSIAVSVNAAAVSDARMQTAEAPAGAQSAYRWTTTSDGVETAHALVLFGAWAVRAAGGVESPRRGAASSAAAHSLAVTVEADPSRLDSLLDSIDFAAMAATLAR